MRAAFFCLKKITTHYDGDMIMKFTVAILAILAFSSCAKLSRVIDGAEGLPKQLDESNQGIKETGEGVRLSKIGVALETMLKEENRRTLSPIPSNMMSAARIMGNALKPDEALLFMKNYLIKVNEENFDDNYPEYLGTDKEEEMRIKFEHNKMADLLMVTLVAGNLPQKKIGSDERDGPQTLDIMISQESNQGAYRDVLFQTLKLRAKFLNDLMIKAGMLDGDKKLDTVGKIEKFIEYNELVEFICKLDFADQIAVKFYGFSLEEVNTKLSGKLDKDIAAKNWGKALEKAQSEFKAQSFSQDPAKNAAEVKEFAARHKAAISKIQQKIDGTKKID